MTRPTKDQWLMSLAVDTARRTTCLRRGVGCVLADDRGKVLSTGYNGPPRGLPHCNDVKTVGAGPWKDLGDGVRMPGRVVESHPHACHGADAKRFPDGCEAVHAEVNALMWCADVEAIDACFVTVEPCFRCAKALLNTGVRRVLFLERNGEPAAEELWVRARGMRLVITRKESTQPCVDFLPDWVHVSQSA